MFSIQELYSFMSRVRRSFADRLAQLPIEVITKNREASFYSMKNVLLHMIDNEDWIVNWVIPGRSREYARRKWEEYADMRDVVKHLEDVEARTHKYFQTSPPDEFVKRIDFILPSGATFNLTVEECLMQSFTEQLYHMGELIALLWQENIEPPRMQWFWNNPRAQQTEISLR